jgi:hypothetical protein
MAVTAMIIIDKLAIIFLFPINVPFAFEWIFNNVI